jgi:hypothetical protein
MSNTLTAEYYTAFKPPSGTSFAPAMMIDRAYYPWIYPYEASPYITTNGFDTIALRVSNNVAPVAVNLQGTYNPASRTISATVYAKFEQNVIAADYRITLLLVEDSIIGSGSGWDQKCYDANFANTHYPGQYNPSTQYISNYPHRKVLRSALLGTWGAAGIIPTNPVIGTVYSTNTNYVLPTRYNASKCYLVAYVARYSTSKIEKYILNANEIRLSTSFFTEIEEKPSEIPIVINDVYPMPSQGGEVHLNYTLNQPGNVQIELLNVLGANIKTLSSENNCSKGTHELLFNTSGLTQGMYFINIKTNNKQLVQKLIVN